jgi:hypothetical protein
MNFFFANAFKLFTIKTALMPRTCLDYDEEIEQGKDDQHPGQFVVKVTLEKIYLKHAEIFFIYISLCPQSMSDVIIF